MIRKRLVRDPDDLIIIENEFNNNESSDPESIRDSIDTTEVYALLRKNVLRKAVATAVAAGIIWGICLVLFVRDIPALILMAALIIIVMVGILFYTATLLIRYTSAVSAGIDNVARDADRPIILDRNLLPVEDQLNDLKRIQEAREAEAIEGEKKKNDLVLFLAHDLKTPLTSVIAYLSTLDANPDVDRDERIKYTHVALVKAHRLWDLIQEFFEITKFNLQDITLEKENLNLSMMLEQMADEMYGVFQEHDLSCTVQTDEDIMVYGDPDKLARVFENLLRNAVNYSYVGTEIRIMAREVGEWIEIVFCNKGKTIPRDSLKSIFEKFYRVDDSRSSQTGGAGLGLAIAREIVELHDGMIRVTSENEETRFIVVLPEKTEEEREQKAKRLEKRIEEAIKDEKIRVPESHKDKEPSEKEEQSPDKDQ